MRTSEIRADWQRQVATLINPAGAIDLITLRALLSFAAVNAPVADTANLFRLFDAVPGSEGTLVPDVLAPAQLPRLRVIVRNPAYRRGTVTPAAPAAAVVAALPEAVRENIRELSSKAEWAGNCLAEITDEEDKKREAMAVQEAGAKLLVLGNQADPNPAEVLAVLDEISTTLAQARKDNELADFVLGDDGNVTVKLIEQLQSDVRTFRDQAPARVAAPVAAEEWIEQSWVDVSRIVRGAERNAVLKARQDALSRSGAEDDLESALGGRFTDEEELAAAVSVATAIIEQATRPSDMERGITSISVTMPVDVTQDRFAEIIGAGLDTAMGRIKPVLRTANVAPGQEDFSARQVLGAVAVEAEQIVEEVPAAAVEPVVEAAPEVVASVAQVPAEAAPAVGIVIPPKVDPIEPRFKVGEEVEYRTGEGSWARDKVALVVPINRTVNGGVDSFLNDILGADASQYHLENGEVVGGDGIRLAHKNTISPLSVPTPAYEATLVAAAPEAPAVEAKKGEWIEYTTSAGETKVGYVESVTRTTDFIPGQNNIGRAPKKVEYSLMGGDYAGPAQNPRRIDTPPLSASQVSAMFFSSLGWRDKGSEHEHAQLLWNCTPSELEKNLGFNPKDTGENYAIARRLCVAFAGMDAEEQASLRQDAQEGGHRLESWVGGMLDYWAEAKKEDAAIAASATGDLKASVVRAEAAAASNQANAEAKAKFAFYTPGEWIEYTDLSGKMQTGEIAGMTSTGETLFIPGHDNVNSPVRRMKYDLVGGGGVMSDSILRRCEAPAKTEATEQAVQPAGDVVDEKDGKMPAYEASARVYAQRMVNGLLAGGRFSIEDAETGPGRNYLANGEAGYQIKGGKIQIPNWHGRSNGGQPWVFSFRELAETKQDSAIGQAASKVSRLLSEESEAAKVPSTGLKVQRAKNPGDMPSDPVSARAYAKARVAEKLDRGYDSMRADAETLTGEGSPDRASFQISHGKFYVENEHVDEPRKGWTFSFRELEKEILAERAERATPDDLDVPEVPEIDAPDLGTVPTVPVTRNEPEGIDPADLHAGKYRVWFLTDAAKKRVDGGDKPWQAVLADSVERKDYELVARVSGANTLEVFYLVGTSAVHEVPAPAEGLKPQTSPKWQAVPTRKGFADPIEELEAVAAGEEPAKTGRGRRR